jgi:hypothetical protein
MRRVFFATLVAAAITLVPAVPASADDTVCTAVLGGTHDNVVVPPGARCTLFGATVRGSVKALENSQLVITGGSTIHGNVEGDKADLVQVNFSTVRQNVTIKEGGEAPPPFPAFTMFCFGGGPCESHLTGATILEGNVQIEKMVGDVVIGAFFPVTVAKGSVKVEENVVTPAAGLFQIASFAAANNFIAQNLQVFKNTGPGSPKSVFNNTAGESIQCFENSPPGTFVGGPNTAPKKEGQCF